MLMHCNIAMSIPFRMSPKPNRALPITTLIAIAHLQAERILSRTTHS